MHLTSKSTTPRRCHCSRASEGVNSAHLTRSSTSGRCRRGRGRCSLQTARRKRHPILIIPFNTTDPPFGSTPRCPLATGGATNGSDSQNRRAQMHIPRSSTTTTSMTPSKAQLVGPISPHAISTHTPHGHRHKSTYGTKSRHKPFHQAWTTPSSKFSSHSLIIASDHF